MEKGPNKLKIVQLSPYYYPSIGGVETVVKYLSEKLVNRGHIVDVLTTGRDHKGENQLKGPKFETINGVRVHRFRSFLTLGHMSLFPGIIPTFIKGSFDIVHMHSIRHPHSIIIPPLAKITKTNAVLQGHTHFASIPKKTKLYSMFDKLIFPTVYTNLAALVAITEFEKNQYVKKGISRRKIWMIPNAVSDEYFEKIDHESFIKKYDLYNKRIILYIGHLVEGKGVDLLFQALAKIVKKKKNTILILIGPDNGNIHYYQRMAKNLKISKHFKWIGRISDSEKRQALAAMDFLALPSEYEAFGLVLIEAMAAGKPVIAASSPGPNEIINHGINGYLIEKGSVQEFVNYSIKILEDKNLAKEMGKNAKLKSQSQYSMSRVIDQWEKFYYYLYKFGEKR